MVNRYLVYIHIFPNRKTYIGITKRKPNERWLNGNGYKSQKSIYNAIKKYGWENINHIILQNNLTYYQACQEEKRYIQIFKSNQRQYGYNRSLGGEKSALGYKHTDLEKAKIKEHNAKYWENKKRGSDFMRAIALENKNRQGKKHTEKAKQLNKEKHSIKVSQFDLHGNFIKTWDCQKDAEDFYNLPSGSISKVCKHKRKTTGGYIWQYNKEWENVQGK